MSPLETTSLTTSLWEEVEDPHGNPMILPSYMRLVRCWFCHYYCCRRLAMLTLPRLQGYLEKGILRRLAGWVDVKIAGHCERKACCFHCCRGKVVRQ